MRGLQRIKKLEQGKASSNKDIILIISELLQGKDVSKEKQMLLSQYKSKDSNSIYFKVIS